ncbi:AAA family ATPase [Micromonospora sp. GCM10011542]|uniref:AAA family ATPase n=1 Tax=Micromonospora sp. GCM10011542 TaxID=3317337 RepID=UPI0036126E18
MPLRKITLENYRCFRDRQEIEMAPVTVVLGKNNSGKSVLTRAPLVIATGFGTTSAAPLDLDRLGPDTVDDFRELFHDHLTGRPIKLGVAVEGGTRFALEANIQYVDSIGSAVVSRLELMSPQLEALFVSSRLLGAERRETPDIDGIAVTPPPQIRRGEHLEYEIRVPWEKGISRRIGFRGLVPDLSGMPGLVDVGELNLSLGPIRYLSPHRERVARHHRLPLDTPSSLGVQGEGMAGILADDSRWHRGEVVDRVNELLAAIVPDWRVTEVPAGPLWSTVLTRRGSDVRVNLADAGTGLAQVLPILVQCALDELRGEPDHAPLQIVEEPEMHLHPAAHAELADLYLRTAKSTGTQFLIETHSETLLLRLRRRIAELDNDFGKDMVRVYVVEQRDGASVVRRVDVDELGNLDDTWPDGYFSQDYREVKALAEAQMERLDDAS